MWLDELCAACYDALRDLLERHPDDDRTRDVVLQNLCVQVTGRNCTPEELAYLRADGLAAFEVLLHGYLQERRDLQGDAGAFILPPSGVVRVVNGTFRPVMTAEPARVAVPAAPR
ncbi:hypothetical protein [Deinococcus pimensis]|uniref:hypothetical protein n=1 Tax=Deinococcus pimensis TaxID=309888 RepID=UPI0004898303|nr:hypothetical protein [Deinococcus pimensis]